MSTTGPPSHRHSPPRKESISKKCAALRILCERKVSLIGIFRRYAIATRLWPVCVPAISINTHSVRHVDLCCLVLTTYLPWNIPRNGMARSIAAGSSTGDEGVFLERASAYFSFPEFQDSPESERTSRQSTSEVMDQAAFLQLSNQAAFQQLSNQSRSLVKSLRERTAFGAKTLGSTSTSIQHSHAYVLPLTIFPPLPSRAKITRPWRVGSSPVRPVVEKMSVVVSAGEQPKRDPVQQEK